MFDKRNNTLIGPIEKIMKENAMRYNVEKLVNEDFKVHSKKALPHESIAAYDMALEGSIQKSLAEGVAQIDEVSKARATEYLEKSKKSWSDARDKWDDPKGRTKKTNDELGKRSAGIDDAKAKLSGKAKVNANEETEDKKHNHSVGDSVSFYDSKKKKNVTGTVVQLHGNSEVEVKGRGTYYTMPHYNVKPIQEEESLEEISKGRLAKYISKASKDNVGNGADLVDMRHRNKDSKSNYQDQTKVINKIHKRQTGIDTAAKKLVFKEETLVEKIMSNIKKKSLKTL